MKQRTVSDCQVEPGWEHLMKGLRHVHLTPSDYEGKKCDCLTHVLSSALPYCCINSAIIVKAQFDDQLPPGLFVEGRDVFWIPGSMTAFFIYVFGRSKDAHESSWAEFTQRYNQWGRCATRRLKEPKVITHWPSFRTKRQLLVWLRKTLSLPTTIERLIALLCPEVTLAREL